MAHLREQEVDSRMSQEASTTGAIRLQTQLHELPTEVRSLIVHNPLEGMLAQRVGCQRCGYVEGLSLVPFICLTVPLGTDLFYDIRECLNEFTALESIEGVECAKCTLLQAQKSMQDLLQSIRPSSLQAAEPMSPQQETLARSIQDRLSLVGEALEQEDFSEVCLKKCQISNKGRVSSTKSRQTVIGRAPLALALHVNRSQFDETTGAQTKNYAKVKFPLSFNLGPWYLGQDSEHQAIEEWETNPSVSMLPPFDAGEEVLQTQHPHLAYQLRAVVTHYGRHENGHYICYRQAPPGKSKGTAGKGEDTTWWQLSDQYVFEVTQEEMLDQGGVFMLFYERVEPSSTDLSKTSGPIATVGEALAGSKCASSGSAAVVESEDARLERVVNVETGPSPKTPTPSDFSIKESALRLPQSVPQALPTPPPSPKLAATLAPTKNEQMHIPQ